jgi:hypothetical protein
MKKTGEQNACPPDKLYNENNPVLSHFREVLIFKE